VYHQCTLEGQKEWWNLEVRYSTECYRFVLIFPSNRSPNSVSLKKEVALQDGNKHYDEIKTNKPIKKLMGSQEVYCVTLYNLDETEKFKVEWDW